MTARSSGLVSALLPDQDLDASVLRGGRIVLELWLAVGIAFDMLDPLLIDAGAHQHVVGHLRARRGQPPIVIGVGLVRPVVGMAADDDQAAALRDQRADLVA